MNLLGFIYDTSIGHVRLCRLMGDYIGAFDWVPKFHPRLLVFLTSADRKLEFMFIPCNWRANLDAMGC